MTRLGHIFDEEERNRLPAGAIVATATLVDCIRSEGNPGGVVWAPLEEAMGDFHAGRYAWQLEDIRKVRPPVDCNGDRGLWELGAGERRPADLLDRILANEVAP